MWLSSAGLIYLDSWPLDGGPVLKHAGHFEPGTYLTDVGL